MAAVTRRQREREERRQSIVAAAESLFTARGVAAVTMDEIAAHAELSKGALYLYFKSKDELYVAVCLQALDRLAAQYEQVARGDKTGLETLRALGRAYVRFARDNRDHFRLGMSWMLSDFAVAPDTRNYAEYRGIIQRLFGIALAAIDRGKRDGSIRADVDAPAFAVQMWGGTVGMVLLAINREEFVRRIGREFDFDALVPSFIDRLLDSIQARPR
jgi:AcrR family transcriptional regulator